jgi:hypothetical protein
MVRSWTGKLAQAGVFLDQNAIGGVVQEFSNHRCVDLMFFKVSNYFCCFRPFSGD